MKPYPLGRVYEVSLRLHKFWSKTECGSKCQCYSAAILGRILFGGNLVKYELPNGERHYWNQVGDFQFDFTSDQYGGDGITPIFEGKTLIGAPRISAKTGELIRAYMKSE